MRYAILDDERKIVNIIEAERGLAAKFGVHYLGNAHLGIGDLYPEMDFRPCESPAETQRIMQQLTTQLLQVTQENKLLKAQVSAATERSDFIEDCIAEMAVQVYSDEV